MEHGQSEIDKLKSNRLGSLSAADTGGAIILVILFVEMMVFSLLFPFSLEGSSPPPAISGNFVMWTVGVIGFQMALIPAILVSFHNNFWIRFAFSVSLAACFLAAHWIAWYVSGISSDYAYQLMGYPLGCAIASLPIGVSTWFFRFRFMRQGDHSKGKPFTIGKMMGLTTAVAIVTAYAMRYSRLSGSRGATTDGETWLFAVGIGIAGFILLLAMFGLRKPRNLAVYFLTTYGVLILVACGGVWISNSFVGRGMLFKGAVILSIAVASLIIHSVIFTTALKMLGFNYRKVESQLRN